MSGRRPPRSNSLPHSGDDKHGRHHRQRAHVADLAGRAVQLGDDVLRQQQEAGEREAEGQLGDQDQRKIPRK